MEKEAHSSPWRSCSPPDICRDVACIGDPALEGEAWGESFLPWTAIGCHIQVVVVAREALGSPSPLTRKPKRRDLS